MDPLQIIALIEQMLAAGTDAVTAWGTVSGIVAAKRNPTEAEWRLADAAADAAHGAVQA